MYENKEEIERVVLVSVNVNNERETKESLDELEELLETAGAIVVGRVIQNREQIHSGTYIGKGKIEEVKQCVEMLSATGIVCDDELSPAQIKNLEEELQTKIMDRTLVILDIFAKRALTKEGKIQVELAQLKYRAKRLTGLGNSLSRLGGGIGTRGPGEKKLEIDRRLISDRVAELRREIADMEKHRELSRSRRSENPIPVVAIVGYTNAGKSTLLNTLTEAKVLEEDKLFATLDPTTRNFKLPSGKEILLTDTVGFIRKLPHHLIDAFKSTLEEAKYADIILHVVDASNPQAETHMDVVYETLEGLKVMDKDVITLFNKQDKIEPDDTRILKDEKAQIIVKTAIKKQSGIDDIVKALEEIISRKSIYIEKVFAYNEASKIQLIRKYGQLLSEEYVAEGIAVKANVPQEIYGRIENN